MLWVSLLVLVSLLLVTAGLLGHLQGPAGWAERLWRGVRPRTPDAATVPVERIAADLRRLADLIEATYATDQPAKMARLTAAALAYDYVLLSACRTLELPEPATLPLKAVERLTTEAELARRGLTW